MSKLLALIGLATLAAANPIVERESRYLPTSGWASDDAATYFEEWFGKQLLAMREPPLLTPADLAGRLQRFRLLVLPTFRPAYAVRVDQRTSDRALIRFVQLNGAGGYEPGSIVRDKSRTLSVRELNRLNKAIIAASLPSRPRQEETPTATNSSGELEIIICADGTMYVFELLDEHGSTIVTRYCGIEDSLSDLAALTAQLGRMSD